MEQIFVTINNEQYSVDAREVQEIIPKEKLSKLQGMPEFVLGYFSFKGEIFALLDVERLGGLSKNKKNTNLLEIVKFFLLIKSDVHRIAIPISSAMHGTPLEASGSPAHIDINTLIEYLDNLQKRKDQNE